MKVSEEVKGKGKPTCFLEATSALDAKQWDKAFKTEIQSMEKNNTWTLIDLR